MNPTLFRPAAAVFAISITLLAGCKPLADHGHPHDANGGHEHEHEEKTAQITVFSARHEVFAEHKAAVVGQPTTFITHVTDLKTLEPRREGPVKFVLRQGETTFEHPQAKPAKPGIYLPGIVFPKPGQWHIALLIPLDGTNDSVALGEVKVFADAHAAQHAEISDAPEGVSFLKEQQWKILSKVEPVGKRRLVERVRVSAAVAARPGALAHVSTPQAGRLFAPPGKALPALGERVAAGQTLALVQPVFATSTAAEISSRLADSAARAVEFTTRAAEAETDAARAKLAIEQAEVTLKRIQPLVTAKARPERDLQEAEFALKDAKARLAAAVALQAAYREAVATLRASRDLGPGALPPLELKSPIAGVVVAPFPGAPGAQLAADVAVFTVLDADTIHLEAKVPESATRRLAAAKHTTLELPGERGRFVPVTGEGGGRLVFTGLQVDLVTRTVPLVYELKNPAAGLRIGEAVTLHIETDRAEDAVAVPDSALVEEAGWFIVFVQLGGETFDKRDVTLGLRDGNWVQVLAGLKEGERIVTKGAYAIRLASVSGVIPAHGHAH
ncbi:MAG: efflux RND transporter periplasmic adaptor subunit [Limisphaerales bacterium]